MDLEPEGIPSEENAVEDEVLDITDSILPQLISEEELDQLQEELEEARKLADENLDGWQRARAEFANYKKRIEREREEERARITGDIVIQYLGVIDDLERALKERPEDHEMASWAEGIDLIYRKMRSILETEGVEVIPAEGEIFDPNYHEAISQEESDDHHEGEILDVIRQGYKIGDRVLRPALVRVAK
ncbi:MAG: nucleotide exchange factor GrpE [Chloroflexi bacterium RBG_16_48_8]|nr:MAG: nucleotide exchange factor GrpE [Chloroflexi bacterium RBG_16_48_8]